ncbi:MAG: hypothetical protein ACYDG4_15185 [Desulfuromonadaceae bacterium]
MSRTIIIAWLLLAMLMVVGAQTPLDAVQSHKGAAPGVVDLQHLNASLFADPGMVNKPIIWLQTKNDTPVGYALIKGGTRTIYQNVSDYIGLTGSAMMWKDAPIAPIGSV